MSALVAVCKSDRIHILTDAACTWLANGTVSRFVSKQNTTAVPGCIIACMSYMPIAERFAELAAARCRDFDALVAAADQIWRETLEIVPGEGLDPEDGKLGVAFAGWSVERNWPEAHVIDLAESPKAFECSMFALGPTKAADDIVEAFIAKFGDAPDSFDPIRDGIATVEELRRRCLTEFDHGAFPLVGGYIEHSEITRAGISTRIIHRWPDRVGENICLEAA
jgi:hypothetical protein